MGQFRGHLLHRNAFGTLHRSARHAARMGLRASAQIFRLIATAANHDRPVRDPFRHELVLREAVRSGFLFYRAVGLLDNSGLAPPESLRYFWM
jgi:hypothetical protein